MLVRHRHDGRWYLIEAPPGSRVFRSGLTGIGTLLIPDGGREVPVFDWPSELLVRLAESGAYGLRLLSVAGPGSEPPDSPP
jgi:hypothetical protein